jgi:predicted nucleic acid-binding protein
MILVSAQRCGAECVWTEDLNHGERILGVEVRNPFRP